MANSRGNKKRAGGTPARTRSARKKQRNGSSLVKPSIMWLGNLSPPSIKFSCPDGNADGESANGPKYFALLEGFTGGQQEQEEFGTNRVRLRYGKDPLDRLDALPFRGRLIEMPGEVMSGEWIGVVRRDCSSAHNNVLLRDSIADLRGLCIALRHTDATHLGNLHKLSSFELAEIHTVSTFDPCLTRAHACKTQGILDEMEIVALTGGGVGSPMPYIGSVSIALFDGWESHANSIEESRDAAFELLDGCRANAIRHTTAAGADLLPVPAPGALRGAISGVSFPCKLEMKDRYWVTIARDEVTNTVIAVDVAFVDPYEPGTLESPGRSMGSGSESSNCSVMPARALSEAVLEKHEDPLSRLFLKDGIQEHSNASMSQKLLGQGLEEDTEISSGAASSSSNSRDCNCGGEEQTEKETDAKVNAPVQTKSSANKQNQTSMNRRESYELGHGEEEQSIEITPGTKAGSSLPMGEADEDFIHPSIASGSKSPYISHICIEETDGKEKLTIRDKNVDNDQDHKARISRSPMDTSIGTVQRSSSPSLSQPPLIFHSSSINGHQRDWSVMRHDIDCCSVSTCDSFGASRNDSKRFPCTDDYESGGWSVSTCDSFCANNDDRSGGELELPNVPDNASDSFEDIPEILLTMPFFVDDSFVGEIDEADKEGIFFHGVLFGAQECDSSTVGGLLYCDEAMILEPEIIISAPFFLANFDSEATQQLDPFIESYSVIYGNQGSEIEEVLLTDKRVLFPNMVEEPSVLSMQPFFCEEKLDDKSQRGQHVMHVSFERSGSRFSFRWICIVAFCLSMARTPMHSNIGPRSQKHISRTFLIKQLESPRAMAGDAGPPPLSWLWKSLGY